MWLFLYVLKQSQIDLYWWSADSASWAVSCITIVYPFSPLFFDLSSTSCACLSLHRGTQVNQIWWESSLFGGHEECYGGVGLCVEPGVYGSRGFWETRKWWSVLSWWLVAVSLLDVRGSILVRTTCTVRCKILVISVLAVSAKGCWDLFSLLSCASSLMMMGVIVATLFWLEWLCRRL